MARGGTLDLTFAPDVNLASQLGRTIDLFDWIGVTPTGAFTVSSPYTWNLTNLYSTGEVTLTTTLAGDVNLDGVVDIFDVNTVSMNWGTSGPQGDANGDGVVDIFDVNLISAHWTATGGGNGTSAVPEPPSRVLCLVFVVVLLGVVVRRLQPLSLVMRPLRPPSSERLVEGTR